MWKSSRARLSAPSASAGSLLKEILGFEKELRGIPSVRETSYRHDPSWQAHRSVFSLRTPGCVDNAAGADRFGSTPSNKNDPRAGGDFEDRYWRPVGRVACWRNKAIPAAVVHPRLEAQAR